MAQANPDPYLTIRAAAIALVLAAGASPLVGQVGRRPGIAFEELERGFADPDSRFAPFAFWFWDAPLDTEHVAEMAREMCRQGLNPGYAHARPGLPRESWLSPEWFEAFTAALEEAEAAGAYLGYCDDYRWPSGQADGRVLAAYPELAAISLDWEVLDVEGGEEVELPESFFTVAARRAEVSITPEANPHLDRWIWHPTARASGSLVRFRRSLRLEPGREIASAVLAATAADHLLVFLNGERLAENRALRQISYCEVASLLRPGVNQLAILARSEQAPGGLALTLEIVHRDGTRSTLTVDESWRTTTDSPVGWKSADFDDSGWRAAVIVGESSAHPRWHLPGGPYHTPATIESASLRSIGEGPALRWSAPPGRWRVYSFSRRFHSGITGGQVNYLDRRLADAFIEIAHEPYARALGARLGASAPGVFVDHEGDYGFKLAWSDDLEREYRERKGRDIRLWMPILIDEDLEGRWARARWDWHEAVSRIYADGFLGSVSRWLEQRGAYCISNLWEETLFIQAHAVGDFFAAQRAVSLPGTDGLELRVLHPHDFKETQSVAELEGRRFQSEILGLAGWRMSPVLMKQAVNAAVTWGVNHVVPHGINLERDLAEIPYPPDWFTANPYWRHLRRWTDFTRRACYVGSHGQLVPEVLLLNPMDSVWALVGGEHFHFESDSGIRQMLDRGALPPVGNDRLINRIDRVYSQAIEELTAARIEFLIADRHYLGQMECTADGRLVRGSFEFTTLVVPPTFVLPLEVAGQVATFAEAGGTVWLLGELPRGSTENGLGCEAMAELVARIEAAPSVRRADEGIGALDPTEAVGLAPQTVFVSGEFPLLAHHRRIDDREFFWLANNTGVRRECVLALRGARGAAAIWDCETGGIDPLPSRQVATGSVVSLTFDPYEAFWLVCDPTSEPVASSAAEEAWAEIAVLDGPWNVRIDPAVQPPPAAPALGAPRELLAPAGDVRPLAPWSEWKLGRFSGFVDYRTTFESPIAGGRVVLDLGEVRHVVEVWLNGELVGARLWPPFEFELGEPLVAGENRLLVRVGNLLCNAMGQHVGSGRISWQGAAPTRREFDAGLLGPVTIRRRE